MSWYNTLDTTEFVFLATFLVAYALYVFRIIRINRFLKVGIGAIVSKILLRTLYFSLLLIALMGPLMGSATKEIQAVGKDIMIAIDLSQSMNATDVQPSRLEKVKFELKNIVNAFDVDRIGIIMFSSEAFVACPLTYDQSALMMFIETLNTRLMPNTGTDFAPPLRMAYDKLVGDNDVPGQQKSKVIILISDGEDFGQDFKEISEEIIDSGVKLFTLGVGTEQGGQILTRGVPKTDRDGNIVVTRLNSQSLKELATQTGGRYYEINSQQNDTARLISAIGQIEGELRDSKQIDTASNKYGYFLLAGLILFVADHLIKLRTVRL